MIRGRGRKVVRRLAWLALCLLFAALTVIIPFTSAQEELEIDAAYLLDVSCSMLGQVVTPNILNQVIDILINEIGSIDRGRIILITFAAGPHDFDKGPLGNGPIRPIYEFSLPEGRNNLLSFIRPDEYGVFHDPDTGEPFANWPGIYEATRGNCGGQTAIYDTAKYALDMLEELQESYPGGKEGYAKSHVQLLVILTDGRDNASKLSFKDLLQIMDQRHWEMEKRFFYKRYYFGGEPPPSLPERPYIDNLDIKPPIPPFFRIRLDRPVLVFPGNLWFLNRLSLDKVQLAKIIGPAKEIGWGEISVKPEGFNLPEGVAIHISTVPSPFQNPFKEGGTFGLNLELTPHSILKDYLQQQGLVEGVIEGYLLFEFSPKSSREGFVDFVYSKVPVKLSFQRPHIKASFVREEEAFCLNLSYNEAFESLGEEQKAMVLDYNTDHFYLTDAEGKVLKGNQFKAGRKFCFNINPDLDPGTYRGEIKALPSSKEVLINSMASFEGGYEFSIVGFDREVLVFPNLWAPPAQIAGDSRLVVLKGLRLYGLPSEWDWSRLSIIPSGFKLPAGIQFKVLNPSADRFDLELMATPYSQLPAVKDQINENLVDGYLQFRYPGEGGGLEQRLVKFKVKPGEPGIPVDLEFKRRVISLKLEDHTGGTLYREDPAISFRISYSEDLRADERRVLLQCSKEHFYLLTEEGERLDCGAITFGGEGLIMKVSPQLSPGTYQGSWGLSTASSEVWLEGLKPTLVQEHISPYTLQLPYLIEIETSQLTFPNLWAYAEIQGNARRVTSEEALRFGPGSDRPDWGRVVLKLGGFDLPEGLLQITPSELGLPFVGDKGRLKLTITDFAELKRRVSKESIEGSLELEFASEELQRGRVEFSARGERKGRYSIPVRIDFRQPNIEVIATPPDGKLGTLHRGDPAISLEFKYDPILKQEQRKVIVQCAGADFQIFDEEGNEIPCGSAFAGEKLQLRVASQAPFGDHVGALKVIPAVIPDLKLNGREEFSIDYTFYLRSTLAMILTWVWIGAFALLGLWMIPTLAIYEFREGGWPWEAVADLTTRYGFWRVLAGPIALLVLGLICLMLSKVFP
jgi:hypothetical protein